MWKITKEPCFCMWLLPFCIVTAHHSKINLLSSLASCIHVGATPQDFSERPWPLFPGPSWVPATMCVSAEWPVCQPFPNVGIRVHLYKITCPEEGKRSYWQVKKRKGDLSFKPAPLKGCKWPMIFDKNMFREFILHTIIKDLSKHNRFEIYHTKICSIFIS